MEPQYTALIVDDDAGVRQSIRLCLEADGARALGVGSALAALEAVERSMFDVVFLDLWLGRETAALLGLLLGAIAFGRALLWGVGVDLASCVAITIIIVAPGPTPSAR